MSDFVVPDAVEPIRGYRAWIGGVRLWAVAKRKSWPWDEPYRAICLNAGSCASPMSDHDVPADTGCRCGIYAYRSLDLLAEMLLGRTHNRKQGYVVGEVDLWGRLAVHEYGYRAEYARVVGLYDSLMKRRVLESLAQRYNAEILPSQQLLEQWRRGPCQCRGCSSAALVREHIKRLG